MPMIRNAYRPGDFKVCASPPSLRQRVEAFLTRTGISRTRFGMMAVNSPNLVLNLERGQRISPKIEARVRAFIENYGE